MFTVIAIAAGDGACCAHDYCPMLRMRACWSHYCQAASLCAGCAVSILVLLGHVTSSFIVTKAMGVSYKARLNFWCAVVPKQMHVQCFIKTGLQQAATIGKRRAADTRHLILSAYWRRSSTPRDRRQLTPSMGWSHAA